MHTEKSFSYKHPVIVTEAAAFYEPIVKKHYGDILSVAAIVLANLCVCYIMTNQNEEAEALMRKVFICLC